MSRSFNKISRLTKNDLRQYFIEGFKKPNDLQVGVEWEKIGVYKDSLKAIRYSGAKGVEAIFRSLVRNHGWQPIKHGPHIIALEKAGSSITLEPGGQIELSGKKFMSLDQNAAELYSHLEEIKRISEPIGIIWLGIGAQPVSTFQEIEWVPKKRYGIMRKSLKNKGSLTYAMMKETASVQISLDFINEKDAVEKLRLAFALSPVLSAMYANSPVSKGKLNGFYSRRCHIWLNTAPERTGIIADVFKPDFNFERYIDYALSVPMLFIVRGDKWIPANGMLFGDFLRKGLKGHHAVPGDWHLHLTTIFTEARLKKYVEVRSIDCQRTGIGLSAPALLKGIFYDPISRKKAWELLADLSLKERFRMSAEVPSKGLNTRFKDKTMFDPAVKLLSIAEEGLDRLVSKKLALKNEKRYLTPLKELLLQKKAMPAELLIACFRRAHSRSEVIDRIRCCAAI